MNRRSFRDTLAVAGMLGPLHGRARVGKPLLRHIGIQLYSVRREMDRASYDYLRGLQAKSP